MSKPPLIDRFWARIEKAGDCWIWTGKTTSSGFPCFCIGMHDKDRSIVVSARRWAYEYFVGPVPDGVVVGGWKRTCNNTTLCVNPAHSGEGGVISSIEKKCAECNEIKPLEEFYPRTRGRLGVRAECSKCSRKMTRSWRAENPEKDTEHVFKGNLRKYNLSLPEYKNLLEKQDFRCAICLTDRPGGKGRFHIDHDHACCPTQGKSCGLCVRGLLCHSCNIALGSFRDDPALLRRAISYLERWQEAS